MPLPEKISLVAGTRTGKQVALALMPGGFFVELAMDAGHVGNVVPYMTPLAARCLPAF